MTGPAIEGAGDPRVLHLSTAFGLTRIRLGDGTASSGASIESALGKLAPDAPAEKVAAAAAVLEGILGIGEES